MDVKLSKVRYSLFPKLFTIDLTGVTGSIEFDVDFFPCAHLKNVVFNEPATETIREVAEEKPAVTAPSDPLKPATNGATKTKDNDDDEEEEDPNAGIIIPRSELLKARKSSSLTS